MEPFIGQITIFAGNFAPRGWALCDGQLLSIAQNTALFSILGTTYGGNGTTTFALPDLRGRAPIHQGAGPGLSPRSLGDQGGSDVFYAGDRQKAANTGFTPGDTTAQLMPPFTVLNFIIALEGIYPSRS